MNPFGPVDETPLLSEPEAIKRIAAACDEYPDHAASCAVIGRTAARRPIHGVVLGSGPVRVSLVSGAHADEPVGSVTLAHLVERLLTNRGGWLERCTFCIVPHANPDGAAANAPWLERWPDAAACLASVVREPPGLDVEFGYPAMRPENQAISAFLEAHGPFAMHASLHGMLFSEGGQLLIDRGWIGRTAALRDAYAAALTGAGLRLFDYDRAGEKGFEYIGPGFASTPRGVAMRAHFEALDDHETAGLFHQSSMEFVRGLGGDPLCLVTELPLWVLGNLTEPPEPGRPTTYLAFRACVPEIRLRAGKGEPVEGLLAPYGLRPLPVAQAVGLQLRAIELSLQLVCEESA